MENSAFGRLIGALVAPGKTFRALAERPTWLLALLVVSLAPLLPSLMATPKMDWESMARESVEQYDMKVSAEDLDKQVEVMKAFGSVMTYLSPVLVAGALFVFALAFWGAFTLAGGETSYPKSLAVVSHGMLPTVISALLSIPVLLRLDRIGMEEVKTGSFLQSSLAAFAPEDAGPALLKLLSKVDVFSIWVVVLFVLGFHLVAKVKPSTAAITVVSMWLVFWVLLPTGLAALPALLAGAKG